MSGCTKCSSASVCQACTVGYYLSWSKCYQCPSGCAECTDANTCSRCKSGFNMLDNVCYAECPSGTTAVDGYCVPLPPESPTEVPSDEETTAIETEPAATETETPAIETTIPEIETETSSDETSSVTDEAVTVTATVTEVTDPTTIVSAPDVNQNSEDRTDFGTGSIIGIVVGLLVVAAIAVIIILVLRWRKSNRDNSPEAEEGPRETEMESTVATVDYGTEVVAATADNPAFLSDSFNMSGNDFEEILFA